MAGWKKTLPDVDHKWISETFFRMGKRGPEFDFTKVSKLWLPATTAKPFSKYPQQTRSVLCLSVFPVDAPPPVPHGPCLSSGGMQWKTDQCRSPSKNPHGVGCRLFLQHGWRVP